MLKKLKPVSLVLWLIVLSLAVPAPISFADDEDEKDEKKEDKSEKDEGDEDQKKDEDEGDEDRKKDEDEGDEDKKTDEDEGDEDKKTDEDEGDEDKKKDDVEIEEEEDDEGKGGKKIVIQRQQTSYRSPTPDKSLFNVEKLSLNDSEKEFLVKSLIELAAEFTGHKQVTHRMRGHALGIAMRIDPENENARRIDFMLSNGVRLAKKFKSPDQTADDLFDSAKTLINGGGKDDGKCAAYLLDLAARISPENEKITSLLEEHAKNGFEADWTDTLEPGGDFPDSSGGELGEATAKLVAAKGGLGTFKRKQTTIKGLVVMTLPNGEHIGQANQLNATALPDESAKGVNIRINQAVGRMMRGSLEEVAKIMQLKHEKTIPSGYKIEIGFADKYTPKDGPSAAVAFTLLLDSLLGDFEIDDKFACTGDISADGNVQKIGGVAAKIRGAARKGCELISVPEGNSDGLRDVAIMEGVGHVLEAQVFAVKNYAEAVEVARTDRNENMQKAIDEFKLVQKVVEKNGESILRHAKVVAKLENILVLAPNHLTATVALEYSRNKLPTKLSLRGSYSALNIATSTIMGQIRSGGKRAVDEKEIESAFREMDKIRKKIDKRIMPYFEALYEFCEVARDIEGLDDPGKLSKSDKKELEEASKVVEAAERSLRNNREIQEEMLD